MAVIEHGRQFWRIAPNKLFFLIRRAETVGSVQRRITRVLLVFRQATCRTVWLPALAGDWSGGFTRLPSSKIYQARVCQRRLAVGKNPPIPRNRGISDTNCSSQYAERKLATGRAVLLDCRQAESIRREFVSGDSPPEKIPRFRGTPKTGIFYIVGAGLPDGPSMPAASGKPTALRWVGRRGRRPLRPSQRINM